MRAVGRGTRRAINIWPGFVDGLATLLLVVIFVLMVFMIAQYFLSTALTGRDLALQRLERQIAELGDLLALERSAGAELRLNVAQLSSELQASLSARESLSEQLAALGEQRDALESALALARAEQEKLKSALTESEAGGQAVSAQLEDAYKVIEADKEKIEAQLAELAILKSLRDELTAQLNAAEAALAARDKQAAELESQLAETRDESKALALRLKTSQAATSAQAELTDEAQRKVDLLNRQILALREQLSRLSQALDLAETKSREQEVQIKDLGRKLNLALATKVQELARYRSEFFGRLRKVLGDQQGVRIVGDRFVFQSEVLFASGSAELGEEGKRQLGQLARTLNDISAKFPKDIDWILRVDGHTDRNPISTFAFPSNWELSTARAISVVRFLVSKGIPAERLAATGFGEFQPLDQGEDEIAFRRNRRIELKLTQR